MAAGGEGQAIPRGGRRRPIYAARARETFRAAQPEQMLAAHRLGDGLGRKLDEGARVISVRELDRNSVCRPESST